MFDLFPVNDSGLRNDIHWFMQSFVNNLNFKEFDLSSFTENPKRINEILKIDQRFIIQTVRNH
jgi:hypothetical protein